MKRNRFSEMIPPVPEDFHASVQDALNRMESVEKHRRSKAGGMRMAAAAAAALVLVIGLAAVLRARPAVPDRVTVTSENVTVRPTGAVIELTEEPVTVEIGEWRVSDDGNMELDWSISAVEGDALLFCGEAKPVFENGAQLEGFEGFSLMDTTDPDYLQIGGDLLGAGNGTVIQRTGRSSWFDKMPTALAIHFDVYRPTQEAFEHSALGEETFQLRPGWIVYGDGDADSRFAMPIDWHDGSHEFKTCFGSKLVTDQLYAFMDARLDRELITGGEALELLQEDGAMRTALLEGYDFAEHVKSFDFIVDLTERSGVGADEIE